MRLSSVYSRIIVLRKGRALDPSLLDSIPSVRHVPCFPPSLLCLCHLFFSHLTLSFHFRSPSPSPSPSSPISLLPFSLLLPSPSFPPSSFFFLSPPAPLFYYEMLALQFQVGQQNHTSKRSSRPNTIANLHKCTGT